MHKNAQANFCFYSVVFPQTVFCILFKMRLSIIVFILACSICIQTVPVSSACLYNSTHCQCSKNARSGICLRYEETIESSSFCRAASCEASFKCDCMGSFLCPLQTCSKYISNSSESTVGNIVETERVSCSLQTSTCVGAPTDEFVKPCIHNTTHCQCGANQEGGQCLRFVSGNATSAMCSVEQCQKGGYKCDCLGESFCKLHPCGRWQASTLQNYTFGSVVPCDYLDPTSPLAGLCPVPF